MANIQKNTEELDGMTTIDCVQKLVELTEMAGTAARTAWVYQASCTRPNDSEEHLQNLNTQQQPSPRKMQISWPPKVLLKP